MKLEDAKKEIENLKHYINEVENYSPNSLETYCIKSYAILGNVNNVAREMNKRDFKIEGRKITSSDISNIIKSEADHELHKLVQKSFKKNKKKNPFM